MTEGHAWSDWLESGDFDLDNDHHLQMRLVGALVDALEEGRPWLAHRLAGHLRDSSAVHFELEEQRMRRSGFPERAAHQAEHDGILEEMRDLVERVDDEEDVAGAIAAAMEVRSTLAAHIGSSDRRLAAHVRAAPSEETWVQAS
jgi:hemerythrin-like metal-binding protein